MKNKILKNKIFTAYLSLILSIVAFVLNINTSVAQNVIKFPASNASNVCPDTQFKLEFSTVPVLNNAGTIKLFKSDGTLLETIDLSQTPLPLGPPAAATWPWKQTYSGSIVNVVKVSIDDKSAIISFGIGAMTYNTGYYVTIDQNVFSNAATLGFTGIFANQWSITTKPAAPTADLDYTVATDGTGDFATIQGALDYIPANNTTNAKIFVKNGIYVGLLSSKSKNNITLEGESVDGVFIKSFNNATMNSTVRYGDNFIGNNLNFINLTFINTTPNGGSQAETISLSGNQNVIVNCQFFSYQDTVLISGKAYLKDCLIEGNVDFIWGNGTVFFQSCEIRSALRSGYNVQARNGQTNHGYAFADCNITSTSSAANGSVLGRDAGTTTATNVYAEIVYLNCTLGSHISSLGWNTSRLTTTQASTIMFAEYKSVDPSNNLINVSGRDPNSKQLSDSQNTQYRDLNWFFNGWTPVLPTYSLAKKPTVSIATPTNGTLISNTGSVVLTATAADADGTVSNVAFYDGTTLLSTVTSAPYTYTLNSPSLGTHIITAVATDNSGLMATSTAVSITASIPVTGVTLPATETVNKNETTLLTATIQPAVGANQNVTWSSSDSNTATVNTLGVVTGVAAGTVTITVTTEDGNKTATCLVTVTNIFRPVTSITISPNTATVNRVETLQLAATILPAIATNKNMNWTTDNGAVATVSATGLVTALSVGTAKITVTTVDGSFTDFSTITVLDPPLPAPLIKLGFNENTGTTPSNAGSATATFTKTAVPTWSTNVPTNGGASSVDFGTTAGNNYVESDAVVSQLGGLTSFTITGWVNCRNSTIGSGGNRILTWNNNGANGVDVVNMSDGSIKVGINQYPDNTLAISSVGKVTFDANAGAANWKFFAITYNSATSLVKLYFGDNATNAVLDKSITYAQGAVGPTIGKLAIGHFNAESQRTGRTDRMFRGLIDEVQIYGAELTLSNIQTIQNITSLSLGQREILENSIKLYPNPVSNLVTIELDKEYASETIIQLFNYEGKLITKDKIKGTTHILNIENLQSGVYIVNVSNANVNVVKRVIKK